MVADVDIALQIKNILVELFGLDISDISNNTRLLELGLDSMHLVDLMLEIETQLRIKVEILNLSKNPSFGEVVSLIEQQKISPQN